MKTLLLKNASQAINKFLALDKDSIERIKKLDNRIIAIELLPMHLCFQLFFKDNKVSVHEDKVESASTFITGTPIQLLSVMLAKENRQQFFAQDIKITGNVELGHEVIHLFDQLQIDWEDKLANVVGDVPAYYLG